MTIEPSVRYLITLVFCFACTQLSWAQQTEVLGKTATVKLSSNLEIFGNTPAATAIWVKRSPLSGTLTLKAGSGLNARHGYEELLGMYKGSYAPITVLSHKLTGNSFRIETRTGTQPYDIRQLIYATYVPQEPGMPQKTFTAVVQIANMSWDSTGGKALRAALESFRPKAPVFKDKEAPKIFMADPVRDSVNSWSTSYTLKGLAWDNVTATTLQVSVKSPSASGFGIWQNVKLGGSGKSKQWTYRLPMQAAKGPWKIQLRLKDAVGNSSQVERFTITRK